VEYESGATYTFTNINWNGQASGTKIFFRNSNLSSGTWLLKVTGTQTVSYVNVGSSDASVSGGSTINATNGTNTNCNNNTNWNFGGASSITFDIDLDGSADNVCGSDTGTPYTLAFGTITTSNSIVSGTTDTKDYICLDLATNASGGAVITVVSANASLKSTSVAGDTIASSTGTIANGIENYGICVAATSASAGSFTEVAPFNDADCAANDQTPTIGAVTTSAQNLVNTGGASVTGGLVQIVVAAAISAVTDAHTDYIDTLTFIATGTF